MTEPDKQSRPLDDKEVFARMQKAKAAKDEVRAAKARSRAPLGSVVRVGAVVVMGLVALIIIVSTIWGASSHESKSAANLAEIGELQRALSEAEAAGQDIPDAASVEPSLAAAKVKGENLAGIQNDMAKLDMNGKDVRAALSTYSDLVDESKKYFSAGTLAGGAMLPQGRWYQPYVVGKDSRGQATWVQLPSSEWSWKFIETKSVTANGEVVGIWTASLADGKLLAWVTGKFDNRRAQWNTMMRGLTVEGASRVGATNSDPSVKLDPPPSEKDVIDRAARERASSPSAGPSSAPSSAPATPGASSSPSTPAAADPGLEGN